MKKHIKIFDTTLRDGEQSPGCSMNKGEKLEVAKQLEKLGIDIIEAGFAISSKEDFDSIVLISKHVSKSTICSLSRTIKDDIKASGQAIKNAKRSRIHTFIATSPIHMKYKLKMNPSQVVNTAVEAIKYAKTFTHDVEFSPEDAGRSDKDFLVKICNEAVKAGATTLNIPDTVGYLTPDEYGALIKYIIEHMDHPEKAELSVHCHDDLGLATANSLAGIMNGATQVECTINGIGERAGNTALEEVVMALKTREDFFSSYKTTIKTKEIIKTSRLVSSITGSYVQANKAIVGTNAFAHEAGIHQDGILKDKTTYEIMSAESIGLKQNKLVLGKHSGRHAFKDQLIALGYELDKTKLDQAFKRFKQLADKKKEILDQDLISIIDDELYQSNETYQLSYVQIIAGSTTRPTAVVQIQQEGKLLEGSGCGAGPVDAIYKTIQKIIKKKINLLDFCIHAVTEGTDALGEVTVRIKEKNRIFVGRGSNLDVLVASTKAYLEAINKMIFFKNKTKLNLS